MLKPPSWHQLLAVLRNELRDLLTITPSDRRWPMAFFAALAIGSPLFVGAWFDHIDYGLIASLGGLVFLHSPHTALAHRMVHLAACAFGMSACYALGLLAHFLPALLIPLLGGMAMLVTMTCRFYRLGPPGSLFFVMAAAIAAYTPLDILQFPLFVGLITSGALLAWLIALAYGIYIVRRQPPLPAIPLPPPSFDFVIFDSVIIGLFVALSLAAAQLLQLERAYWVPISCLAVIQGMTLRAVWIRQIHRIVGTAIGLLLTATLLFFPLDKWSISLLISALAFIIELLIFRHYGLATIFITPLSIFLAEATHLGHTSGASLMQARLFDTILGAVIGLLGGICLHSPGFRAALSKPLRRLLRMPG